MEEMIGDTMDMMDDDDIEEAADEEVSNILFQITDGMLGEAGNVGPALEARPAVEVEEEEDEEEGPELDMMQKRLQVNKVKAYFILFCAHTHFYFFKALKG